MSDAGSRGEGEGAGQRALDVVHDPLEFISAEPTAKASSAPLSSGWPTISQPRMRPRARPSSCGISKRVFLFMWRTRRRIFSRSWRAGRGPTTASPLFSRSCRKNTCWTEPIAIACSSPFGRFPKVLLLPIPPLSPKPLVLSPSSNAVISPGKTGSSWNSRASASILPISRKWRGASRSVTVFRDRTDERALPGAQRLGGSSGLRHNRAPDQAGGNGRLNRTIETWGRLRVPFGAAMPRWEMCR